MTTATDGSREDEVQMEDPHLPKWKSQALESGNDA